MQSEINRQEKLEHILIQTTTHLEEKVRELSLVRSVSDVLLRTESATEACERLLDVIIREISCANCSVMLLDEDRLILRAARGQAIIRRDNGNSRQGFKLGQGIAGQAALLQESIYLPDTAKDRRFIEIEHPLIDIRSLLCFPLVDQHKTIGVLNLSAPAIDAFTGEQVRILSIIANQAAVILANLAMQVDLKALAKAGAKLEKSEDRYRDLLDNASDLFVSLSIDDARLLYVNKAFTETLGYDRAELHGIQIYEVLATEYIEAFHTILSNLEKSKTELLFDTVFLHKSGKEISVEGHINIRYDLVESPTVRGIFRDVTIRREASRLIHEREKQYVQLFESVPIGLYRTSPEGYIFDVNTAFWKMLKYPDKETLLEINVRTRYLDERERDRFCEVIQEHGAVKNYEGRWKCFDDSIICVRENARCVRDEEGDVLYYDGSAEDITQRKFAAEAIRRSEERYALALRAANAGSWDWNIETGELIWSETIEHMFGMEHGQFERTYEAFLDRVHPDDRQRVIDCVKASIQQHADYNIEHRIVRPDGSILWFQETGDVFYDDSGKPIRMIGIVQDINRRKAVENQVAQLRRENEGFMRHELRNMIATVVGYTDMLAFRLSRGQTDKLGGYVDKSQSMLRQITELIEHLKLLQDFELDNIELDLVDYFLPSIVETEVHNLQYLAREQGVSISYVNHLDSPVLFPMDTGLIPGVFHNLIKNAIEHVGSLTNSDEKIVTITLQQSDLYTCISINNRGETIPPQRLETFFEKFNSDRSRKADGTGLGTTYAYLVTKAHGGDISVRSDNESGTTVTVRFPTGSEA